MSLLAPLFLLGLLAAVIPWWLHRLSSENPPVQDFGSSMFLEASESMSSRQTRLRYLKLLSLRVLFLAALVLLFAEPVIDRIRLPGASAGRHVLIIDTSLSQTHSDRWDRTHSIANGIIDDAAAADEVIVIGAGGAFAQTVNETDTTSPDSARQQVALLEPTLERLDFGDIGGAVSATVRDSQLPVHLHLISDLQATAMPERFSDLAVDGIAQFDIHSTATANQGNIAISARLDHAADDQANITVIASNFNLAQTKQQISVADDKQTLATATVSIDKDTSTVHRFNDVDTSAAQGKLTITSTPVTTSSTDDMPLDNQWVLAVPDGERSEISVVTGTSNPAAFTYVAAALESDPRFIPRLINGDSLSASDAGVLVIVPDASVLSDRAAGRLSQYLSNGGNALVIVGDGPHGTQTRQLLGISSISATQSATLQAGNGEVTAAPQIVSKLDPTHPLTASLAANWRSLSIQRHLPLNVSPNDRRIVDLGNGDALLFERQPGEGKALILTSAIKTSWNNLAIDPLFVAFLVRSVEYLSGSSESNPDRSVGEVLSLPPGAQLLDPGGNPLRDLSALGKREALTLNAAGVYRIRSSSGTQALSVNYDTRESDIRSIDTTTLAQWKSLPTSNASRDTPGEAVDSQSGKRSFWQWLIAIAATLALLESLYSHRHLWIRREA